MLHGTRLGVSVRALGGGRVFREAPELIQV